MKNVHSVVFFLGHSKEGKGDQQHQMMIGGRESWKERFDRQAANRVPNVAAEVVNAQINELPSAPAPRTEEEVAVCLEARNECKFFTNNGFCCRGAVCKFSHDGRESRDEDKIAPIEKRQRCKFFGKHNWCRNGAGCRHKHGNRLPQEGDEIEPIRPRQECKFFKRNGHCKHGSKCKHLHGGRDPRQEDGTDYQKKQRRNQRRRGKNKQSSSS